MSSEAQHFDYGPPVIAPVFHPEVYLSAYPHTLNPALIGAQMEAAASARLPGAAIAAALDPAKLIAERQQLGNWRTEALAQQIAQKYLQGSGAAKVEVGPEGGVSATPYGTPGTAMTGQPPGVITFGNLPTGDTGLGHYNPPADSGAAPQGQGNLPLNQSPAQPAQPNRPWTYGGPPSASSVPLNAAVPLALNALEPSVQQPVPPSEQAPPPPLTPPSIAPQNVAQHVAPPSGPTGKDVFDWYNGNIAPARSWYRETNPDGSLGRFVMQHKDQTIPDQPVHPDYFSTYGQPARAANPSIAASPIRQSLPIPLIPPQNPNPLATALASGTLSPDDIMNAGGGLPGLMASSEPSSGIRSTDSISPYRPGFGPTPSLPSAPVTQAQNPEVRRSQPNRPMYPIEKGEDDLNDADSLWQKRMGISRGDFGKGVAQGTIRYAPGDQSQEGNLTGVQSTGGGTFTDPHGYTYPVMVDQSINQGTVPPMLGSIYHPIKLSPFEERRVPIVGDPYTVSNPLAAADRARVFKDIQDAGVSMDPENMSRPALEAAWKLSQQTGPLKDMPEETARQMNSLWYALKVANTEQHLLDSIPPEQRSVPAGWASRFATTYGPNIPAPVASAAKFVTGGNLDVKNTNEPLKELEDTHTRLLQAIKTYNQESGSDIPGGLRDPHDPDAPTAFRQWEHDWFAPHVAASTDYWTSKNYRMPKDFVHQANMDQFGQNYPGGYPANPIILKNDDQYHKVKAMNLEPKPWVQDAKGVFQLK